MDWSVKFCCTLSSKCVICATDYRTVARKFSIGWLCSYAGGGLDIIKLTKTQLIYSVSRFNLGGLELCLGRLSPPKLPRGDGTDYVAGVICAVSSGTCTEGTTNDERT